MPLSQNAEAFIRANLAAAVSGGKPRAVAIGSLTDVQLKEINSHRRKRGLPEIAAEIVFVGKHVYESRVSRDGYSIEDVILQIENAVSAAARLKITPKMTVIENPNKRDDGYGNKVNDQAVFECTSKFPRAELYSVIPKGDRIKPCNLALAAAATVTTEKGHVTVALPETATDPPG